MADQTADLLARLRKQAVCVYLAAEEWPAKDLADGLTQAADRIEALQAEVTHAREQDAHDKGFVLAVEQFKAQAFCQGLGSIDGDTPDELISAIKALKAQETGWQDISTAPKDGTWVLAQHEDWNLPEVVQWSVYSHCWQTMEDGIQPTHWMPLPPPPGE